MITCPAKCGMKLLIHSWTPTVALLKFGNGWCISSHILNWKWLLIHDGIIEVNNDSKRGRICFLRNSIFIHFDYLARDMTPINLCIPLLSREFPEAVDNMMKKWLSLPVNISDFSWNPGVLSFHFKLIVVLWYGMDLEMLVNIGLGNGLLTAGTKTLSNSILTFYQTLNKVM